MDRAPRWIFAVLTAAVLGWALLHVPWETRYYAPGQARSNVAYVHADAPL